MASVKSGLSAPVEIGGGGWSATAVGPRCWAFHKGTEALLAPRIGLSPTPIRHTFPIDPHAVFYNLDLYTENGNISMSRTQTACKPHQP